MDSVSTNDLVGELQSLEKQRADHLETVHRIDGAIQMVRHLLAKAARPAQQPANGEPSKSE